ncbi:MAG: PAS domain-containing protein, partial [Phenylobacterium sp.]
MTKTPDDPRNTTAASGLAAPPIDARELLESMSDGYYALSPDWRFIYVNRVVETATGRSREAIVGLNVWELFPHAVGSEFWQAHQDAMNLGRTISLRTRSAAVGRWVEATLKPLQDGGIGVLFRDVEEERLARERLDSTEDQLRMVLESVTDGFLALDRDWRFTVFNAACERFFDRPRHDVLGQVIWDLFPSAGGGELEARLRGVAATGEPANFEYASRIRPGALMELRAAAMGGGGVALAFTDITARKLAEAALAQSEERLRDITDAMPVLISYVDADQRFQFVNKAYEQRFRRPLHQIRGELLKDVFGDALYEARRPFVERALAGEHVTYEVPFPLRDRVLITAIEHIPHRSADGRVLGMYTLVQDVTEQKRIQDQLEANQQALEALNATLEGQVAERTAALAGSERRFRAIFDSSFQFMALLAPDGVVLEINQTALRLSRQQAADLIGRKVWATPQMAGDPALAAQAKSEIARAAAGEAVRSEHQLHENGKLRAILDFSVKPVNDEAGRIVWLVAEARDITALKQAQEQLRQSQKMEAIGQLTGGIAHDFNNMLTIIRSSADLLRRHELEGEKRRRYVDAISDTADRAAELTSQLLSFARRQALKPVVFDVTERVGEIARMIQSVVGTRIRLETQLSELPCFVEADRSQFETALINMAVNARDAMDGEGVLTIGLRRAFHAPRAERTRAGEFVAISVSDTGQGIAAEQIERIFEPFYTTKPLGKGTGLGLSQVYGFAKQSGGEIVVDSPPGRGATFTLYLPATERRPQAAPALTAAAGGARTRARILVVEDNADVGEFARQLLHDFGYETAWAADPAAVAATAVAPVTARNRRRSQPSGACDGPGVSIGRGAVSRASNAAPATAPRTLGTPAPADSPGRWAAASAPTMPKTAKPAGPAHGEAVASAPRPTAATARSEMMPIRRTSLSSVPNSRMAHSFSHLGDRSITSLPTASIGETTSV